jgi:hypothetical protein
MCRVIVGTLLEVGKGKMSPEDLERVLKLGHRSQAGVSVCVCGWMGLCVRLRVWGGGGEGGGVQILRECLSSGIARKLKSRSVNP